MIGKREGLSNRYVTSIRQNTDGLIWIGTYNGLNVYDGYNFKHYYSGTHDFPLPGSRITTLFSDIKGNLLIGTNNGLRLLDEHGGNNVLLKKEITAICQFDPGTLLVASGDGEISGSGDGGTSGVGDAVGRRPASHE